jgi:hypothetical protein
LEVGALDLESFRCKKGSCVHIILQRRDLVGTTVLELNTLAMLFFLKDFVGKCSFGEFCSPVTPVKHVLESQCTSWGVLRKLLGDFLSNLNSDLTTLTGKQDNLEKQIKFTQEITDGENIIANVKFIFSCYFMYF